jgi:hypothetical protein
MRIKVAAAIGIGPHDLNKAGALIEAIRSNPDEAVSPAGMASLSLLEIIHSSINLIK